MNEQKSVQKTRLFGVVSCDDIAGELLGYLESLEKGEAIEVVLDSDEKLENLKKFISKTKYKVLDVQKADGKYVVTLGCSG